MSLGPTTLEGQLIRLEPLRPHHADGLQAAGRSPEIWTWLSSSIATREDANRFIATAAAGEATGRELPFAVVRAADGEVVGSTRYLEIDSVNRSLEIGWTWYAPEVWGTAVNPEAKLLLMQHAFEDWGARRVWLKTDNLNHHSQAAMRKLGAVYEGTLRNHRVRRDGSMRDTVVFSVIDSEWPGVKAGLLARLEAFSRKAD